MNDFFQYLQKLSIENPDIVEVVIDEDGEVEIEIDYDYFIKNLESMVNQARKKDD